MKQWFWLFRCVFLTATFMIDCGNDSTDPDGNSDNYTLQFDGAEDYVDCGNDSSLNITEQITIAAWIKGDPENSSFARIVDKYSYTSRQGYDLARASWVNSVFIEFFAPDGNNQQCAATTPVFDNTWHHVAGTYDGNALRIYVDGILENENVIGEKTIQPCSGNLLIGNGFDGSAWFPFKGCIDEVNIWNTALDSLQIRSNMENVLEPENYESGLAGYYRFDKLEDLGIDDDGTDDVRDSSSFSNHGDTQGGPLLIPADDLTGF